MKILEPLEKQFGFGAPVVEYRTKMGWHQTAPQTTRPGSLVEKSPDFAALTQKVLMVWFLICGFCPLPPVQAKELDGMAPIEKQDFFLATMFEEIQKAQFRNDCSGFVEKVLEAVGHDLQGFSKTYNLSATGVRLIEAYTSRTGTIFKDTKPEPGDLIFFSKTYDRNRNQKIDDSLTHVGIVENVQKDGTIEFVHVIRNRIRKGHLNLNLPETHKNPEGRVINSYLRRAAPGRPSALSSHLFDYFGRLH